MATSEQIRQAPEFFELRLNEGRDWYCGLLHIRPFEAEEYRKANPSHRLEPLNFLQVGDIMREFRDRMS